MRPVADSANQSPAHLGELLEDTLGHAKSLIQAEFALARREVASQVTAASGSVLMLLGGIMFVQAALSTLGVLLVLAFGVGAASAALVVVLAAIGVSLAILALGSLKRRNLSHTSARLQLDAQEIMETVK